MASIKSFYYCSSFCGSRSHCASPLRLHSTAKVSSPMQYWFKQVSCYYRPEVDSSRLEDLPFIVVVRRVALYIRIVLSLARRPTIKTTTTRTPSSLPHRRRIQLFLICTKFHMILVDTLFNLASAMNTFIYRHILISLPSFLFILLLFVLWPTSSQPIRRQVSRWFRVSRNWGEDGNDERRHKVREGGRNGEWM